VGIHPLSAAVFLDRDGVLNRAFPEGASTRPPRNLEELEVLPEAPAALQALQAAGFALVGVTNQPDVARGLTERSLVEALNTRLREQLPLLEILTCFHDYGQLCDCRKPRPGLLFEGARRFGLELGASYMIGDRWSDIVAGQAAGCVTLLLEGPFSQGQRCTPDWRGTSLRAAADWILARGPTARR
jgi:D-glycero-D-manno-heptose 1,7-bisphosphate phosphatase